MASMAHEVPVDFFEARPSRAAEILVAVLWLIPLLAGLAACSGPAVTPSPSPPPSPSPRATWLEEVLTGTARPEASASVPAPPAAPPPASSSVAVEAPRAPGLPLQPPPPDKLRGTLAVTTTAWSLTASIHPSLPPFTFSLTGHVGPPGPSRYAKDYALEAVDVAVGPPPTHGVESIAVSTGGKAVQRLARRPAAAFTDKQVYILDLTTVSLAGAGAGAVWAGGLELLDMDGDGYLDLAAICSTAPKWMNYQYWLYSPAQHRFVESRELEGVEGLTPRHGKLVTSMEVDMGTHRFITVWGFEGARVVALRSHEIFWDLERKGVAGPKDHAYVVERERQGGQLVVIREGLVPFKDVNEE
jgi:hypothetical protein